jgi:hypothetical protein
MNVVVAEKSSDGLGLGIEQEFSVRFVKEWTCAVDRRRDFSISSLYK